ncbi:MAG TPA: hypothetical protein VG410_13600 [Solirubrobacteraceae bacterium]|jgi:hypothetical protein|nr:hypothetical protein [Solirubrobacteraceae bacterium]
MPGESGSKRARSAAARVRPGAAARRPADRHYLAVVAAEARRLGRQLRPPMPSTPMRPEGSH